MHDPMLTTNRYGTDLTVADGSGIDLGPVLDLLCEGPDATFTRAVDTNPLIAFMTL